MRQLTPDQPLSILDEELWRRSEARSVNTLLPEASEEDHLLIALVRSLARLAAQRDAKAQA